jgi:hypothetical protein
MTIIPLLLEHAMRAHGGIARRRSGAREERSGRRRGGMWQKDGFRRPDAGTRGTLVYSRRDYA